MKVTWCHNRLAIGSSDRDGVSLEGLVAGGITHIINCRCDKLFQKNLHVLAGVVVLSNPVDDDGEPKSPSWFGTSIDFALGALASPRHKVCIVCCEGNNRAPSTALAVLMAQGLSYDAAFGLVNAARPGADVRYREDAKHAVRALGYV